MTPEEFTELIDLFVADELPEALRSRVEAHLATQPDVAGDVATLRATIESLHTAPMAHPDVWYVERLLDTLLREQAAERPTGTTATPALTYRA